MAVATDSNRTSLNELYQKYKAILAKYIILYHFVNNKARQIFQKSRLLNKFWSIKFVKQP